MVKESCLFVVSGEHCVNSQREFDPFMVALCVEKSHSRLVSLRTRMMICILHKTHRLILRTE